MQCATIPRAFLLPAIAWLAGCAAYNPKRLPDSIRQSTPVDSLKIDPSSRSFGVRSTRTFDPTVGFDEDEIAMLAVANDPDLRESRSLLGVSTAQAFSAGLLPDPHLSVSTDLPLSRRSGEMEAFGVGLGFDVRSFLLRSSRKQAATAEESKVRLDLLWQEWQVIGRSRLLFVKSVSDDSTLAVLQTIRSLLDSSLKESETAIAIGNVTVEFADADRTSWRETTKRIGDLRRQLLEERNGLDGLLGLAMGTRLRLVPADGMDLSDSVQTPTELGRRILARPDIRALRAGYASQEASVREAVLEQFPSLGLGFNRSRDVGGTNTVGFGVDLDLPLFNRNRGNIAVAKATREQLFAEYSNRIARSRDEAETALENLSLLGDQSQQARAQVSHLDSLADFAEEAYGKGELARDGFVRYRIAALEGRIARIELDESRREQIIALKTLLGPAETQEKEISP